MLITEDTDADLQWDLHSERFLKGITGLMKTI